MTGRIIMKAILFNLVGIFLLISSASAVSEQTFYASNSSSNTYYILMKNVYCPTYKSNWYKISPGTSNEEVWTANPSSVCSRDDWYLYIGKSPTEKGNEWGYYKDLGKCSKIYISLREAYQIVSVQVVCGPTLNK